MQQRTRDIGTFPSELYNTGRHSTHFQDKPIYRTFNIDSSDNTRRSELTFMQTGFTRIN